MQFCKNVVAKVILVPCSVTRDNTGHGEATINNATTLFTIFALSAGFQLTKINIGNTGNQNHPDLRVVLVTCISNIDYFKAGNQPIMQ